MEPEARSGWLARDMEKKKSYSGWSNKSGQEVNQDEKGQVVAAGLSCSLAILRQPRRLTSTNIYPTEDTLANAMSKTVVQDKTTTSVGPYLHKDGTFRNLVYIQKLAVGTAIYGATESIYTLEKGCRLGSKKDVFLSKCGHFVLKKRDFLKDRLDPWKLLPQCKYVMPLSGVIKTEGGCVYLVTERMQCDLRQARKNVMLQDLANEQTDEQWMYTKRNYNHMMRSILKGTIHLNQHGYQHYDMKEDNILANKPKGCECSNNMECTCCKPWEYKISDFDTLNVIKRPVTWICGTKYYRPPESEGAEYNPKYGRPTYDSWSILVILLHFCCGTAREASDKKVRDMPWFKNQECHYAKDRLRNLARASNPRLSAIMRFVAECLEDDFKKRRTPEEMLKMWDTLCV